MSGDESPIPTEHSDESKKEPEPKKEPKPEIKPGRSLSQIRGDKRTQVTNALTKLKRFVVERDLENVKKLLPQLKTKLDAFESSHEQYHSTLEEETDIDTSDEYYAEVVEKYVNGVEAANFLIDKNDKSSQQTKQTTPEKPSPNPSALSSELLMLSTMDKLELNKFSGGDPLDYLPFITSFDELFDKSYIDDTVKLTRLLQYTEGKAYDAIKMCRLIGAKGYNEARKILERQFNDKYEISAKLIDQLKSGPKVCSGDDFLSLSHELLGADKTLEFLGLSNLLHTQDNVKGILSRFPPYVYNRYKKRVFKHKKEHEKYPDFSDFVNFVRDIATETLDPLWGSESEDSGDDNLAKPTKATVLTTSTAPPIQNPPTHFNYNVHAPVQPNGRYLRPPCPMCGMQDHPLFRCDGFRALVPAARREFAMSKRLCFLCLFPGHPATRCSRTDLKCTVCGESHVNWLHMEPTAAPRNSATEKPTEGKDICTSPSKDITPQSLIINSANTTVSHPIVVLPMVKVVVNDTTEILALLDQGSDSTWISNELKLKLKLSGKMNNYRLNTLSTNSGEHIGAESVSVFLHSSAAPTQVKLSNVLVAPQIPARAPKVKIDLQKTPHLKDLPLIYETAEKAHMLIGLDNPDLLVPLEVRKDPSKKCNLFAVRTHFGWSLAGKYFNPFTNNETSQNEISSFFTGLTNMNSFSDDSNWHDDEFDDRLELSQNDKAVLDLWDNDTTREDGHYVIPIPFLDNCPCFPDNRAMAEKRLNSLVFVLRQKGAYERYDQELMNMVAKGYAEEDPHPEENDEATWIIPTFPVINPDKDKVRPIHDCRAKYKGVSFNNQVHQGPDLNNKLFDVLLRFRQYSHAMMSDIKEMYMQVRFPEEQRKSLKFLWFKNGEIQQYRMKSHIFGGKFCASSSTYAVRRAVAECEPNISPSVKKALLDNCYVDNVLHSESDKNVLKEVASGVKEVSAHAGMLMTQYVFNDMDLMASVPEEDRERSVREILPEMSSNALGMSWSLPQDAFCFKYNSKSSSQMNPQITKRSVLSKVSQLYDPLGLLSPITLKGKVMFQELVKVGINWDTPVSPEFQQGWHQWIDSLKNGLELLKFNRCLVPGLFASAVSELHTFSDGSNSGYSCVCYIRSTAPNNSIHVALVAAKSRLTPKKGSTIPRIELAGATIGGKLSKLVTKVLDIPIINSTFWSDSKIVLGYIKNEQRRFKPFVANRVSIIRQCSDPSDWKWIDTKENPADIASRGCFAQDLPEIWYTGPAFLSKHKSEWPEDASLAPKIQDDDPELSKQQVMCFATQTENSPKHPLDVLIEHFSCFYRLKKATAWLLRAKDVLRKRPHPGTKYVTANEFRESEKLLITHVQSTCYREEIADLEKDHPSLKASSPIRKLDPVLVNDVLVVGGRINEAPYVLASKNPIILPRKHKLSELIVKDVHDATHLGTEWTLCQLRRKYWIVKGRQLIKKVKNNCVNCKKLFGRLMCQKMANLPPERCVAGGYAFKYTGCDACGPFRVKYGRGEIKRYALIFTCFSARAIHVEKLDDLSADNYINALIRFCSRRGQPTELRSDNATNFTGASNELKQAFRSLDKEKIITAAAQRNINWIFNPPLASEQSGVWERQIRTFRKVLTGVLGTCPRALTDEGLNTVFCEAENIVNSRPLTYCSDSIDDFSPLTPNHLLLFQANNPYPWGKFDDAETYRKQWKYAQTVVDSFWKRWLKEYLPFLQNRIKWQVEKPNLKVGSLCMMADEGVPFRGVYPMAKVTAIKVGRDGRVRSVTLKSPLSKTPLVRPITKLINLECD